MDTNRLEQLRKNCECLCIHIPELKHGNIVVFGPGTGDNLLREDIEAGYVDYINWTSYDMMFDGVEPEMKEYDGGMVLLEESYEDLAMEDIVRGVLTQLDNGEQVPTDGITVINMKEDVFVPPPDYRMGVES